jgi:hypothetical protein
MTARLSSFKNFLFPEKAHPNLGLFRIILCTTLFYIACWRQLNLDQLREGSLIPRDMALTIFPDFYRPMIQWFFWPDSMVAGVHFVLILLLGLGALGLSNRFFLLLAWAIHQGILNRNYAINFGADSIGGLFLFYLAFTNCCEFYSIKNKISFFKNEKSKVSDLSSAFYRLAQIQICVIYTYTGFEKLKGQTWWDGTALWTVFANPQFSQYDLKFLNHVPWVIAVSTFLTVFFETYFAPLVLNPYTRKYILAAGFVFHLSIGFLLGLMPFSLVMLSTYVLFLSEKDVEKILSILRHKLSHFGTRKI